MRTIYYEPAGRIQNAQWDLINYPPEGYQFTTKTKKGLLDKIVDNNFIFNKLRLQVLDKLMPLNLVKADLMTSVPNGTDLIYSYNHLVMRKVPWVVQVEWPHILIGRDPHWIYERTIRSVEKHLLNRDCKKIFTWTQAAYNAFKMYPHRGPIQEKAEVMTPAIHSKSDIERSYDKDTVNLLFVGSINDIHDFEFKGGPEVLEAARYLADTYKIHLTIRASVPEPFRPLVEHGYIKVLDKPVPKEELDRLFRGADIFVFPSHLAHNHAPLEAMSYGLPVVTTYIGSSFGEYVENGKTGFVSPPVEHQVRYFTGNNLLRSETTEKLQMLKEVQKPDSNTVEFLLDSISKLIKNPDLRKQMGEAGKKEVDEGRFSIKVRNGKLKKVFEEALQ